MKILPRYPRCFVCGKDNPLGLNLRFYVADDSRVTVEFTPSEHYMGFKNVLHGGIISSVLDEAMGWSITAVTGSLYVTGELNVRFKRPAPVAEPLTVTAWACGNGQGKTGGRVQKAEAELIGKDGIVLATASGTFFEIPSNKLTEVLGYLQNEDGSQGSITGR